MSADATQWECTHSLFTKARRSDAWAYWSDLPNHAAWEPGVERIEVDGPLATGTAGRTISGGYTQEWTLTEVVDGRRFEITGLTPDGEGSLSFAWDFEDEASGTRMTQRIRARGPRVAEHLAELRQMEAAAPAGLARLAAALDRLAEERWHGG